eukprot:TRINITY_DN5309_c0_g1_i1.p2 TRINITY_DN5309_c0_g1~~TRINITY_DN5309_c0_g1_i1.p2  ORF type:complete len:671 (-),score=181.35 TRINITY_DN5309_c0_g1_i1:76-2088(-)
MADEKAIATIRTLSADIVEQAKSGHPGAPMGMAPIAHVLFSKVMNYSSADAKWMNRDRFVLSNGHASALLYSMLHLAGYKTWSLDTLKTFRQLDSAAAGHPENHEEGIEVTTGPLGQGVSNAVGIALAEAHYAAKYNTADFKLIDHYTYVTVGDGCLQEGVSSESASVAGHLGLGKLIVLYDDNKITIDGSTDLSFTEDVLARYAAYGWHTSTVENGDTDVAAIEKAIEEAKAVTDKPSLIKVSTVIGFGAPTKAGSHKVHGAPLGTDELAALKTKFGFSPEESFVVPADTQELYAAYAKQGNAKAAAWNELLEKYVAANPELGAEFKQRISGELPAGWDTDYPTFSPEDKASSTRVISGEILNHFATKLPQLFGGSADLNPSCFTYLKNSKDVQKGSYDNLNIHYGVREHAMSSISNGLDSYGGVIPFCSTFLNFIGYAYGAVVLSALSKHQVLYIFTHDSVFLGEDGPTHQPIEKYALVRATPNINFIRPADGNEVVAGYIAALRASSTPTVFSLSRQGLPQLKGSSVEKALKGGYVLSDCEGTPELILVGTGSETSLLPPVQEKLTSNKIRVVSLPCWELFDQQSEEYRLSVFPDGVPVLSVEAASTTGWGRYAHASVGIDRFGASAPGGQIKTEFGMNVENVTAKAIATLAFYTGKTVYSRLSTPF